MTKRLMRKLRILVDLIRILLARLWSIPAGASGRMRIRRNFVVKTWKGVGDLGTAQRVAVFSHHDRHGRVYGHVERYLRELTAAGFAVIFVSNSRLSQATVEKVANIAALVIRRRNVGYDYGAYRDGLARIPDLDKIDLLLFANDSVYGPFRPLSEVIGSMPAEQADVWGITDSWWRRYHLQSYFLLLHRAAIQCPAVQEFWRAFPYVRSREWLVRHGEVGFTRTAVRSGLGVRALYEYSSLVDRVVDRALVQLDGEKSRDSQPDLAQERVRRLFAVVDSGTPLNPAHHFWELLLTAGCPFLKRHLILKNPARVPLLSTWRKHLTTNEYYDTGLIDEHLKAVARNRTW